MIYEVQTKFGTEQIRANSYEEDRLSKNCAIVFYQKIEDKNFPVAYISNVQKVTEVENAN